ncbi:MAG: N-acetyltransferase [Actinomycetota bacterium]|nr:N-acetyltransferase [Actinomycetota bacterium]
MTPEHTTPEPTKPTSTPVNLPRLPAPVVLMRDSVRLEPLTLEHVTGLHVALDDDEVWRWLQYQRPIDETATGTIVVRALEQQDDGVRLPFAILVDGVVAGTTSYWDSDIFSAGIEIGATFVGKPWWRSRVNTTAKILLLQHAFETYGYERVLLKTDLANTRSSDAIARLGAVQEGVLRHHMLRPDGTWRDSVLFSILLEEWPAMHARLEAALAKHAGTPTSSNHGVES